MRLKIILSKTGGEYTVVWPKMISDFPKFIQAHGHIYEFISYDASSNWDITYDCYFGEVTNKLSYMGYVPIDLDELLYPNLYDKCECGAKYDRDFPNFHMFFCPKYKPRD